MISVVRRTEWLLFAVAFIAFGYFHQGGGWNANGRFAMTRAIVEQGTLAIDSYLIYTPASESGTQLRRVNLRDAEYETDGKINVLVWLDRQSKAFPINQSVEGRIATVDPANKTIDVQITERTALTIFVNERTRFEPGAASFDTLQAGQPVRIRCALHEGKAVGEIVTLINDNELREIAFVDLRSVAASGDVSYYGGHFYPNKAPGASFIAVPAYWIIHQVERLTGSDPEDWWTLTLNAWLTSVFSVGILSVLGVVLFYRLALNLSAGNAPVGLLATLTFAFGTMFFPYATCAYEHNIIAVCLLASFFLLYRAKTTERSANTYIFISGFCAGYAAITNYIIAVVVIILGLYLVLSVRRKNGWLWFGLGLLGPLLLICAYNNACFDNPFTTNYRHQNPYFRNSNAFLDVFVLPRVDVFMAILFSPFRGLFFSSPVLLLAAWGLVLLSRNENWRPEIYLATAIIVFLLLFNISFEAWDAGWTVAPRYLGPAMPFLALGLVASFVRLRKTTCLLGALSIAIMLLITAVDPQSPVGVSDTAKVLDKSQWQYDPIGEYEIPIFLRDRPWPLIREQEQQVLGYYEGQLATENLSETERTGELDRFRDELERLIQAHEPAPLVLRRDGEGSDVRYSIEMSDMTTIVGPVSVNVGGIYGGGMLGSRELRWNSFNAGEFLFPENRWSLLPLLVCCAALGWFAIRAARRVDATLV